VWIETFIALDPAGPLFGCGSLKMRLDPSDARIVLVLHTNGDEFFKGSLGTMLPMGHVDFYANGGLKQPVCGSTVEAMWKKITSIDCRLLKSAEKINDML